MKIDLTEYKNKDKKEVVKGGSNFSFNLFNSFSDKQKEEFYREFSTLIKSGVDFNQALIILTNQQKSKHIKAVYKSITNDIVKGKSLYEAIKRFAFFSPYEYYSIKIGEETKRLPEVFDQLQKYFTRKIKMKRQVKSVLAYPIFVLLITFGVLFFMLNYVVPMFSSVFKQFGKELPKITQFVVELSNNFNGIMIFLLLFILSIFIFHKVFKNNTKYQSIISSAVLRIPFFGKLIKKIYLGRFCQTLSLLLAAKTPLVTSLELIEKMTKFHPLKKGIIESKKDILKGFSLADSLEKHHFFPAKMISLTKIGEQVNELDKMYDNLSNQYNEDIDYSTKMIGTILEPIMILIIGGIVGFILVAMYSPIFDLSKVIGS